jgi:hypothetical protein
MCVWFEAVGGGICEGDLERPHIRHPQSWKLLNGNGAQVGTSSLHSHILAGKACIPQLSREYQNMSMCCRVMRGKEIEGEGTYRERSL